MRSALEIAFSRRRWSRRDSEVVNAAFEASGLSMAEFSRRHGLQAERLRRLRSRLAKQAAAARDEGESVSLVPVMVSGAIPLTEPATPATLDVTVGPGVVHVPVAFDDEHLRRVVAVLAASC